MAEAALVECFADPGQELQLTAVDKIWVLSDIAPKLPKRGAKN